jgi:hypothetical protein
MAPPLKKKKKKNEEEERRRTKMCGPIFVVRDVKETEEWQRSTVRIV